MRMLDSSPDALLAALMWAGFTQRQRDNLDVWTRNFGTEITLEIDAGPMGNRDAQILINGRNGLPDNLRLTAAAWVEDE